MNTAIEEKTQDTLNDNLPAENEAFIASGEQYLTFLLGEEAYGFNILSVKEIRGWDDATLVPNSPHYMKGVVNLRGTIVPIIDLRVRFDVGEPTYLPTTVVVIVSGEINSGERTMGFIVDAVSDVLNVQDDELKLAPDFHETVPTEYIHGLVNSDNSVATILEVNKLLIMDE